ncbi:MAG: TetR/AcrR family transcriptional regulator, partial [Methylophaga sp.]
MTIDSPSSVKRDAILNATLELLASSGFHGFSIKQLAAKAGVATGT